MSLQHFLIDNNKDSEYNIDLIKEWTFVRSTTPITYIVIYLIFVLKVGPMLMAKRSPMSLKNVLIAYNAFQVLLSAYLCYTALTSYLSKYTYNLKILEENNMYKIAVSNFTWTYVFAKITELLDTVFFILRKKQSQVTFLHVYHHSYMIFISWFTLNCWPSIEASPVIGFINSFVHIVMYSYYLIAALGPQYQKYIWWKKYMTVMQLIQFCTMMGYLVVVLLYSDINPKAAWSFGLSAFVFFVLFMDFYRKEYVKKGLDKRLVENASKIKTN